LPAGVRAVALSSVCCRVSAVCARCRHDGPPRGGTLLLRGETTRSTTCHGRSNECEFSPGCHRVTLVSLASSVTLHLHHRHHLHQHALGTTDQEVVASAPDSLRSRPASSAAECRLRGRRRAVRASSAARCLGRVSTMTVPVASSAIGRKPAARRATELVSAGVRQPTSGPVPRRCALPTQR
jgi:hypothetical protein